MSKFNLSYIISTRNRLPLLQNTIATLLEIIMPNEEIIVVDGNSSDGTKEYLQKLFQEGKIHQFISEIDKNQAHGWNKAMLLAQGTIIKKIIDDDVFDYNSIRICANYMLLNPSIDVVISNDLSVSLSIPNKISKHSRLMQYQNWIRGEKPSFTFGDVHMLIRKSSLAYIGLYHTDFIMMDWEYSLRISYLKANIVYYTGYNALSVFHRDTVSANKNRRIIDEQGKKGAFFYDYAGDAAEISTWSKIKIAIGKKIYKINPSILIPSIKDYEIKKMYINFQNHLNDVNKEVKGCFITKNE